MPTPDVPGMFFRDYLTVLGRRKWVVIASVVVVVGSAIGFSALQTPVYESHARVLIRQSQSLFDVTFNFIDAASIQTEIQLLQGEGVQSLVRERLGSVPGVTASVVGTTAVIDIAAQSASPRVAARVATTYAEAYVDYRRQEAVDSLLAATKELEGQVSALDAQITDVDARSAAASGLAPGVTPPPSPESASLRAQRDAFKQKLDQASVDTAIKNGDATLVSRATVPVTPISPTPIRNAFLGLLLGLIVGVAIAFVVEQFDDSLKTKDDLERLIPALPVLGVIPRVPGWRNRAKPQLVSRAEPSSPTAEAYRTLRTSVQFLAEERTIKTVLVTSPTAGNGKTTTLANLAVALARGGQQVVVVSCDLRRPRIHEFFDTPNDVGFTSVILGTTPLSAALCELPSDPRIRILPSGPLPMNPAELLSSRRTRDVLASVASLCDIVLIDCPPVLPVTDATVLSSRVDGTLVVAAAGTTTRKQLSRTIQSLRQVDAAILGVVLNSVTSEEGYGYKYGYRPDEAKSRRSRRASKNASSTESERPEKAPKGVTPV